MYRSVCRQNVFQGERAKICVKVRVKLRVRVVLVSLSTEYLAHLGATRRDSNRDSGHEERLNSYLVFFRFNVLDQSFGERCQTDQDLLWFDIWVGFVGGILLSVGFDMIL